MDTDRDLPHRESIVNMLEAVSDDAMGLQPAERVVLAHRLLARIEPAKQSEVDAAWDAEEAFSPNRRRRTHPT